MISFKNKKAGRLRIWWKRLPKASCLVHERNLQEMCLYISGGAALVRTLRCGCMKYIALAEPSEITITVRKRGYVVLLESTEIFEFCVVSIKIPISRSRHQDITYFHSKRQHTKWKMRRKEKYISQFSQKTSHWDCLSLINNKLELCFIFWYLRSETFTGIKFRG